MTSCSGCAEMKQRSRLPGVGELAFELFAAYVQVDLLPAEAEGLALYRRRAAGKDFQAHAEQPRIKIDARLFVIRGQHKVVETFEHIRSVVAGGFAKLVK